MLLSLVALIGLAGCGSHKGEETEEKLKFTVTGVLQKDTLVTREYVCQIRSIRNIELRALEKGYLQQIFVDEGQFVKEGQLMFRIMPNIYQAELHRAAAEVKAAEIEVQNAKALADKNVVSKNELAMAQAKLEKAKAEMELAQTHLGFTEIRAPFSGIMDRLRVRRGSLVDEGDLLTTLSDNSKMWVYFNVPEAEYLNFKLHSDNSSMQNVSLRMANNEMFDQPGKIETIESEFDNETGNIAFRATFGNPKGLLRHGETGNILINSSMKNAMIIPQKATFEVLEKKYVFVVDNNNVVHQREIKIAAEMPDLYVLLGGIKPTEKILLEGIRKVKDLEKIEYKYEDPKTVMSHLNVYVE